MADRTIVIGLGTGRCGSVSLQRMLNQLESSFVTHEGFMLPWYGDPNEAIQKMRVFLQETDKLVVGDVGFYWLPYVDPMISSFQRLKFICLRRAKDETVRSYIRKTEGRNHWMRHDGRQYQKDVLWDRCYPKFEATSKEEALEKYWEMYYETAALLEKKYPEIFRVFEISVLSSADKFRNVLNFIGIRTQAVEPVRENVSLVPVSSEPVAGGRTSDNVRAAFIKKMYWQFRADKKFLLKKVARKITKRGHPIDTVVLAPLRRNLILKPTRYIGEGDDITTVIAIRNVEPFRLYHALQSIRGQEYGFGGVSCVVVDYGSSHDIQKEFRELTEDFGFEYVYVDEKGPWNRSRALNVGIRRARSRFVVSSDVDIIFSSCFFNGAVKALKSQPCSVVYSYCLDLGEEVNDILKRDYYNKMPTDIERLRNEATKRWDSPSRGIHVTYRRYYSCVRGYDQNYVEWGAEDDDLYRRFVWLGLDPIVICNERSFYCHIWHEKWGGLITEKRLQLMAKNMQYFERTRGIKKNSATWGLMD